MTDDDPTPTAIYALAWFVVVAVLAVGLIVVAAVVLRLLRVIL